METEVYHVGKDEWRLLEPFGCHKSETLFAAKGKLHLITPDGIYGHEIDGDGKYLWTRQHEFELSKEHDRSDYEDGYAVDAVQAVNDGLLAAVNLVQCSRIGYRASSKQWLWYQEEGDCVEFDK
ncbi:unnamed protein product [Calypogeia fissa]